MLNEPRDDLFGFLLLQDFDCHVVDCAVVKHDYTAVRAGFYMHTTILAKVVIAATEVITYCLNCGVESLSRRSSLKVMVLVISNRNLGE